MPRVAIKKKDYMIADFTKWVVGEMHTRGLRQEDMGQLLGISQQAFAKRVKTKRFNVGEAMVLFHEFDTPVEKIGQLLKY